MLQRLMHSSVVFLTFFFLLLASGGGSFTSRAAPQAALARHGLTGSYYAANTLLENDVPDNLFISQGVFYSQIWFDRNDFGLPRPLRNLKSPMAGRLDSQVAFGQGKGFNAKPASPPMIWWPTGFSAPAGWISSSPTDKPWDYLGGGDLERLHSSAEARNLLPSHRI